MKITAISSQVRNKNRVNISVDGKYRFSLDLFQVTELGIKVGNEYEESKIISFEQESQFGKVYSRALEYSLVRPRSEREVKNYLYRKTRPSFDRLGNPKAGVPADITGRVMARLIEKDYVNDQNFAKFWVDNRSVTKGSSRRKLVAELKLKGVNSQIIDFAIDGSGRSDSEEIKKIIAKKRARYPDDQKFIVYLARLGFSYEDIKQAIKAID